MWKSQGVLLLSEWHCDSHILFNLIPPSRSSRQLFTSISDHPQSKTMIFSTTVDFATPNTQVLLLPNFQFFLPESFPLYPSCPWRFYWSPLNALFIILPMSRGHHMTERERHLVAHTSARLSSLRFVSPPIGQFWMRSSKIYLARSYHLTNLSTYFPQNMSTTFWDIVQYIVFCPISQWWGIT